MVVVTVFGTYNDGYIKTHEGEEIKVTPWRRDIKEIKNALGFYQLEEKLLFGHPKPEYVIKNFIVYNEDVDASPKINFDGETNNEGTTNKVSDDQ